MPLFIRKELTEIFKKMIAFNTNERLSIKTLINSLHAGSDCSQINKFKSMYGESKRECTNICFDISLSNFKNSDNSSTEVLKRFYKVAPSTHFNSGNKSVLGVGKFGVFYHVEDKWHDRDDAIE